MNTLNLNIKLTFSEDANVTELDKEAIIENVRENRSLQSTQMNATSSRSHVLLLMRMVSPIVTPGTRHRWVVHNVRTGETAVHLRPGPSATMNIDYTSYGGLLFESQRMLPFSDSVWLASFDNGEIVRTENAGQTWSMVDNIDADMVLIMVVEEPNPYGMFEGSFPEQMILKSQVPVMSIKLREDLKVEYFAI